MRSKPVFFDPTGKRAVRLSWSVRIVATAVAVICIAFVVLLLGNNAPLSTNLEGSAETLFRPPVPATVTPAFAAEIGHPGRCRAARQGT